METSNTLKSNSSSPRRWQAQDKRADISDFWLFKQSRQVFAFTGMTIKSKYYEAFT